MSAYGKWYESEIKYWKKISYKYEPGCDDLIQNGVEKKNIIWYELSLAIYAFPGHNLLIPVLILFVADFLRSIFVIFFLLPMSKSKNANFVRLFFPLSQFDHFARWM